MGDNIPREEKQAEAIRILKAVNYYDKSIKEFKNHNKNGTLDDIKISVMVNEPPLGAQYYVEDDLAQIIYDFERENNAVVYAVVRSFTNFGQMDSLLFVGDYREDWMHTDYYLNNNLVYAYVVNRDDEMLSDMGSIAWKKSIAGGLIREF